MNCKEIQSQIRRSRNVVLLSSAAQAHVAQCGDCARLVKATRVERLLLNAIARAETPEPLNGFEQRVLARARDQRTAPNGSTATVIGRLAWRLVPALAVVVVALFLFERSVERPQQDDLSTLVTGGGALEDGWGSEMAQLFSFEPSGGGTR